MQKNKKNRRYKPLLTILILIILAVAALYNGPVTRRYTLQTDKIDNEITVGLVSDLHSQYFGENQEKLINRLIDAQPDIILMPGDMTNFPSESSAMVNFMEQAVEIAPCYYVLGNHEYWSREEDRISEMVETTGVIVLRSQMTTIDINGNTIQICGIDDYDANYYDEDYQDYPWKERLNDLWSETDDNNYRILMSHRPEKAEHYLAYQYDLIVAGHAHGGQVRIPFILNGLYSPNQGWFPKYAGGEYQLSDYTTLVVSRGLYNYRWMPRVFNPSEIVVITISQNN